MPSRLSRFVPLLWLALILLLSGGMSLSLFSQGHLWYDDFAGYLLQARALLNGQMAQFVAQNGLAMSLSDIPSGPAAYPWGFPLLLAPLYALGGLRWLTAYKLLNTAAFAASTLLFWRLARRRLPAPLALAVTAVWAFSPPLLQAQDLIQSDFVFLLFSLLTLAVWEEPGLPRKPRAAILLGILMALAFFVRTTGLLLLAAFGLEEFLRWREQPQPGIRFPLLAALTFGGISLALAFIFPNGQTSYLGHYALFFSPQRLAENAWYYLSLPASLFGPFSAAAWLVWPAFLLGLRHFGRTERPAGLYLALSLMVLITWPERQGLRFLYPLLPFWLLLAARGLTRLPRLTPSFLTVCFGSLAALMLLTSWLQTGGALFQRQEINGPFDPYSQEMFAFVRQNLPPEAEVIFFKPRLMTLLGGHFSFQTSDCRRLKEAAYLALRKKDPLNGQVNPQNLAACAQPLQLQLLFENKRFWVYGVISPP